MQVSKVKENLGKKVLHKPSWSEKEQEFILNAYIYRIDPSNPNNRIHQLELQDNKCGRSVMIVTMDSVKAKEMSIIEEIPEIKAIPKEKIKIAIKKLKENLKNEGKNEKR